MPVRGGEPTCRPTTGVQDPFVTALSDRWTPEFPAAGSAGPDLAHARWRSDLASTRGLSLNHTRDRRGGRL